MSVPEIIDWGSFRILNLPTLPSGFFGLPPKIYGEFIVSQSLDPSTTRKELAEQRTEWALERTRLANERTLIAWLRTGLALLGFGAIVPRLLGNVEAQWLVNLLAVLFVVIGSAIVALGVHAYRRMTPVLTDAKQVIPWPVIAILAGAIEVAAITILILFILY